MTNGDQTRRGPRPSRTAVSPLGSALRRRMLLAYLAVLLGLYSLSVVVAVGVDSPPSDARGEALAAVLCVIGLIVGARPPLRGWRYIAAVVCASTAPIAAMLFHDQIVAQVWSVVPLMFVAVFLASWHRPITARVASTAIAVGAAAVLVVAPAPVPAMWLVLYLVCIPGAGEVCGWVSSALIDLALRDPLTTVWNRAGIERQAQHKAARARRRRQSVAMIVLDVDDFKAVNDRDGHLAGDAILVDLTQRWCARLPASAVLGRVGGDEFVVVLSGYGPRQVGALAAELVAGHAVHVSYGLTVDPDATGHFEALFAEADEDLYRRKRRRKSTQAPTNGVADSSSLSGRAQRLTLTRGSGSQSM
ncbi:GGDEF domain-containing protein [Mycolicibacterium pulveris]|uniref:GGDEF domain-containing protein n=1 Tax=Mycolicibacterium pulveris TaxID=36813 RepID=UPI003CEA568D